MKPLRIIRQSLRLCVLAVVVILLSTGIVSPAQTPRAIPARLDSEFKPEVGIEYTLAASSLYHPARESDPGPAERDTSIAWSFANEFVYRTALAKDYAVPARESGPTEAGWHQVIFAGKDGKSRLVVEVDVKRSVGRLPRRLVAADGNPVLKQVAVALRPVLEKLDPQADIAYPGSASSLVVGYRSQPYKIHGRSMTGEVSPDAHDEIGPSFQGFVLRVHLQDKGEINQAVTPQTIGEPYWQTYLDVTPIEGTQKQIYWALSYGSRTDANLLSQIRKALNGLQRKWANQAEPAGAANGSEPIHPETKGTSSADGSRQTITREPPAAQIGQAIEYHLQTAQYADTFGKAPEYVYVVGEIANRSLQDLEKTISLFPKGSMLQWAPSCRGPVGLSENQEKVLKDFCDSHGIKFVHVPSG